MDTAWPVDFWIPSPGRVPDGVRVYAVGDIHGRADLVERMLDAIDLDMARGATGVERFVAVFLGDYIDRGPRSRRVLDILSNGMPAGLETEFLMGNHEHFLVSFLDGVGDPAGWLFNGGMATLASYGVQAPGTMFPTGQDENELRDALLDALPERHMVFLRNLTMSYRLGDFLFVHAGVRPGVALDHQAPEDMLWIRGPFLTSDADLGAIVVHGHTITPRPLILANRIALDTGAHDSGRLTCGVFEADRLRFLQT
ncbi:serine/threonine protein phosphatase [Roseospira navarrensis]|uniref:Serine/threonine protein phosphatase n=2 Tax=Roseospira navarrensis TaxID=140058 RepID=A0A7X1ZAY1_9PROT|nr:serine/threonine protein phosphatase [Roseospira navarrensis]